MKTIFPLFLLLLFSCSGIGNGYHLPKIAENEIEFAEIKKTLHDSISVPLNSRQISTFISVTSDSPTELRKAIPKYWIVIKTKNDSVIKYKILDHYIGEKDAYAETDLAAYFKKIYETSKKSTHLISLN